jgi:hypothetical protein
VLPLSAELQRFISDETVRGGDVVNSNSNTNVAAQMYNGFTSKPPDLI